ncbi:hypothetical protein TNCT_382181 [Trichonephila clavata]|uniref:Uncharacterized protein n=1 Tax=Trichonephila clavata TaxID=2740835 RepID=A0A8X6GKJ4_TRICU|nr:hypothetical protein TNCT_382181 [Trichonephila clavata]
MEDNADVFNKSSHSEQNFSSQIGEQLMTMNHILHFNFQMLSIQTRQPLRYSTRLINAHKTFTYSMLLKLQACEIDVRNIWFSNESNFLHGFVNKQS